MIHDPPRSAAITPMDRPDRIWLDNARFEGPGTGTGASLSP